MQQLNESQQHKNKVSSIISLFLEAVFATAVIYCNLFLHKNKN